MSMNHIVPQHGLGYIPDLPDIRDLLYAAPEPPQGVLPPHVDLRPGLPPVYDQGQLGSCTANAIGAAVDFERNKQGLPFMTPSRLFIYYNERAMEGTIASDAGAMIRDGIKSVSNLGVCAETEWPYVTTAFTTRPSPPCYVDALLHQVVQYKRLPTALTAMRGCLASGYPFVFGFTVYESFESQTVASTGVVPMPAVGEQVLGGHAVVAVGYDDPTSRFIVRNSWGDQWGDKGYFTMPYAYLLDPGLSDDYWTIRLVEAS